ncbi:TonB-dependent receptor [Pseudokordiimonas caeni]|uniref:TonB-dependent receptor n=1 Tax=Pseudokordiimonas caeni TaxID=2997908 RepID=UPI002811D484|nr:TonB-dependent receptor [Pseudokordiimonas caeni]
MSEFVSVFSHRSLLRTAVSSVALIAMAGSVAAQDEDIFALEEIVVTAQKRAESLQDVPVSISAAMGDKIEKAGISDFQDLSETMPGVHISRAVNHTPIAIRGISSGVNRAFDQSVGLFIDGIGMARGRQYRMPFLDIERIEVLRGPQGALFGKNTIAGALNVTTVSPGAGDDFNGFVAAKYEPSSELIDVSGAATVPLGDTAALRVAARYADADGFVTNVPTDTDAIQPEDATVRGTLVWTPSDNFKANLKYTHSHFTTAGSPIVPSLFTLIDDPKAPLDALAFAAANFVAPGMATDTDKTHAYTSINLFGRAKAESTTTTLDDFAATLDYNLASGGEITSVTGYSTYKSSDEQDTDFLPINLLSQYDEDDFDQFSQELRYASPVGETVEYLVGGYYENSGLDNNGQVLVDSSIGGFSNIALGIPSVFAAQLGPLYALYPMVVAGRNRIFTLDTESYAAFGQFTWNMNDAVRLTVGGRYTHNSRDAAKQVWLASDVTSTSAAIDTPDANPLLAAVFRQAFGTVTHDIDGHRTENHFDPTATISWDVNNDVMLFARFAQGHKMGGFNASDDQAFDAVTGQPVGWEFEDERARTYEVGMKSTLMDGRGRLNATVFQTDYSDLQVTSFQGTTFSVSNAANSRIRGLEADFEFRATEALTMTVSGAWLDFTFKDFTTAGCTAAQIAATAPGVVCQQDLSGRTNAFAPKFSGVVAANYTKDITESLNLTLDADVNYRSTSYLVDDLDEAGKQDAYAKINARIAIASVDETWSLAIYGRNLTDKITLSYIVDTPLLTGAQSGVANEGRTIGLEARFRF